MSTCKKGQTRNSNRSFVENLARLPLLALLALAGSACAEQAHEDPEASATPTAVQAVAVAGEAEPEHDDLAATRAAVEKQRAEVEALRSKLAQAEQARDEAAAKKTTRRSTRTRNTSKSDKSSGSGRKPIVLDEDTGDPL